FTIHMTLLGEKGLTQLAAINHANAVDLAERLADVPGVEVLTGSFFNEFTIRLPGGPKSGAAAKLIEKLAKKGILAGVPVSRLLPKAGLDDLLILASTEINTDEDRAALVAGIKGAL
ncbi:MAG: glycine dehydrogenase, partial [Bosea sp. (in: a-proteobacteria)]